MPDYTHFQASLFLVFFQAECTPRLTVFSLPLLSTICYGVDLIAHGKVVETIWFS